MAITVEGISEFQALLQRASGEAIRNLNAQLEAEAVAIQAKAREYAPVDEGNLESAIVVEKNVNGRDSNGRFAKSSVVVKIDGSVDAGHGRNVGDYAWELHEHQTPFGPIGLGPRSREKDGGRGVVGGKFFERAVDERTKNILDRMIAVAKRFL